MDKSATLDALASYVPTRLLRQLLASPVPARKPSDVHFDAAVLYAEMIGFDDLLARLVTDKTEGVRKLAKILNAYFNLWVDFVKAEGGDIMSLSGNRGVVLWPAVDGGQRRASVTALVTATRRAAQCALSLHNMLHHYEAMDDVYLALRVSVGAGKVFTASVGGALGRWEFMASGATIVQVMRIMDEAQPGDILISPQAYALMRTQCVGEELESGNFCLENVRFPLPARTLEAPVLAQEIIAPLRAYIPGAVLNSLTTGQSGWLADVRDLTVLYVNIPAIRHHTELHQVHQVMRTLQRALYRYAGSVNKLILGSEGMVLTAALGLPPLSHQDDPVRAVQAALLLAEELQDLDLAYRLGLASGKVFCGAVGSARRREYTMIGETVTRARRLMLAVPESSGVLCDAATYQMAQDALDFDTLSLSSADQDVPVTAYAPVVGQALV